MSIKKETAIKHVTIFSAYLIIVWGFYRIQLKLPETVDELIIKPVLWLIPLFYFLKKEKLGIKSLGITTKNLLPSIYFALILGIAFAIEGVLVNYLKYGHIEFEANLGSSPFSTLLILSMVTAVVEEFTFRGYLFNRLWNAINNEWVANLLISFVWVVIHLPIAVFWWDFGFTATITFAFLMFIYSLGASFIFARTENVFSSVLLHFLWGWPVVLFR